jgi:acyl carrier protein
MPVSIEKEVLKIITDTLCLEGKFSNESTLAKLGADSLDILQMVTELEIEFDVDIADHLIFESMRVVHLVEVVQELVYEKVKGLI